MSKPIKRGLLLGLLGLLSYLIFLLVQFPAGQAYALFGHHVPAQLYGLTGTVWSGQAAVAQVEGQRLEALQWQLQPARLLRAELGADVAARVADGSVRSHVRADRDTVTASDLRLDLPVNRLLELAGVRLPARVDGRFDMAMRELQLVRGQLTRADGILSWHNASVNLGRPLPLGTINLRLEPGADGSTRGVLMNQGGPLAADGNLEIQRDGDFVLELTVSARDNPGEDAQPAMRLLGIPTDGTPIRARLTGNLDGSDMRLVEVN